MLTIPPVSSIVSVASTVVPVGSSLVVVAELVAGQHGRSTPRVGQDPDIGKGVDVVRRRWGQSREVPFRVVVCHESVGIAAGAGRVP